MFLGPPPPIASSMVSSRSPAGSDTSRSRGLIAASTAQLGSLLFEPPRQETRPRPDSVWRGLRRQEKALEQEIQQLLDLQATGLVAGSGDIPGMDQDGYSDAGSSTPTGTFYSTASTKSRMVNSLHVPTRSNAEGNVIPVRQPRGGRPMGLRSARAGLRKTMMAMVELKQEEDLHIDAALSERRQALVQLSRLATRRHDVSSELQTFEDDAEEPLGKELRELGSKYDGLTHEIRQLEERLVAMRNHRRSVREKMQDVKSRRDAGLSGYRGALKDVDSELQSMMQHPPIQPLDPDVFAQPPISAGGSEASGGMEFIRLIPERRTADMAKSWWEAEVTALESRRKQIDNDKKALEEGTAVWREVMTLVTSFESSLRQLMKTGVSKTTEKGKEKAASQEDIIRDQLPRMDSVIAQLEQHIEAAEDKGWNLLICAIGAELEAFREAQAMLKGLVDAGEEEGVSQEADANHRKPAENHSQADESDNEVPADLLVSHADESSQETTQNGPGGEMPKLERMDTENEVPPEFLAEHHDE